MFSVTVDGDLGRGTNGIHGLYKCEEKAFQVASDIILCELGNIYYRNEYDELLTKASKLSTWKEVYQLVKQTNIQSSVTVEKEGLDKHYPDNIKHTLLKNTNDYEPKNIIYNVFISAGHNRPNEPEYIGSFKSEENAYEEASKQLETLIEMWSYPGQTYSFEECKNETSWVGVYKKLYSILETRDYEQYVYIDEINLDDIKETEVGNIHDYFCNK